MDIRDFKKRKKVMEDNIRDAVEREVGSFKTDTGCSPSSIDVGLCEVTGIADTKRGYKVSYVISVVEI